MAETDYSKIIHLLNVDDLCCLTKVLRDFRQSMRDENITAAINNLVGKNCDDDHNDGSLGELVNVLKQHNRLMCGLDKNCRERLCKDKRKKLEGDEKPVSQTVCGKCCDDEDCCQSCRVTLVDLLEDLKRINESRLTVSTFHKDLVNLVETCICYYNNYCSQPCLPQCDEMYKNIMYLIKLCVEDCGCKEEKDKNCCGCKPDSEVYPIVMIIYLSLFTSGNLSKYVELYCLCCEDGDDQATKPKCETFSVAFCDKHVNNFCKKNETVSGTICDVEIPGLCKDAHVNVNFQGVTVSCNDATTVTSSGYGVLKDSKGRAFGTVYGTVIGTLKSCGDDEKLTGIFSGTVIEFKNEDPCDVVRNPYVDAQTGLQTLFNLINDINVQNMIEILGGSIGSLGRRVLHNQKNVQNERIFRDHSKKYITNKNVN